MLSANVAKTIQHCFGRLPHSYAHRVVKSILLERREEKNMSFSSFLFTVVRAVQLLFSYVLARTFPLCLLPPRHRGCSHKTAGSKRKEISMKQHFRHVVFAFLWRACSLFHRSCSR